MAKVVRLPAQTAMPGRFSISNVTLRVSVLGTKRQFARCKAMTGVGGKADLPVERPDFSV